MVKLNMKLVVARFGVTDCAGKAFKKEWNVVLPISSHPTANAVKRDNGNAKTWHTNDKHRLIAFLIPTIFTAELPATYLKNIRAKNRGHALSLCINSTRCHFL